ncbi:MAG TPA: T9SS type A sorting domain-containing protein [bacterium]|nr:T9SS type A sorting domain-containing protein [bacterium]
MKHSSTPNCSLQTAIFPLPSLILLLVLGCHSPAAAQYSGVYELNGGTARESSQTYAATAVDQSSVYVLNSGNLTLVSCTMTKTGDASSTDSASQYGLNAGVLANSAGKVTILGGSVTTNALGGNGLFASGSGSSISMSNGTISASGGNAHGVDATYTGSISLTDVDVTTNGASSSALATDFGGGTVTVNGGTIVSADTAANSHSAGIYSTGTIQVTGATVSSLGDCGGVIDGANSILLTNTSLTGKVEGIKLWKTAPATGAATVTISGGSLTATAGDAIYVTGETGNAATASITASNGAAISAGTGNIIHVIQSSTGTFAATGETLSGNLYADSTSTLTVTLRSHTSLTGKAQMAAVAIDSTSTWTVTANSILTTLNDSSGISGTSVTNITGNGHDVHYDSSLTGNRYLGGLTYNLINGGVLTPGSMGIAEAQAQPIAIRQSPIVNLPNPFSRTTSIAYELRERSHVRLTVTNLSGQQVATLLDETRDAGRYETRFDGSKLASGIYLVRLSADGVDATRKMIVRR